MLVYTCNGAVMALTPDSQGYQVRPAVMAMVGPLAKLARSEHAGSTACAAPRPPGRLGMAAACGAGRRWQRADPPLATGQSSSAPPSMWPRRALQVLAASDVIKAGFAAPNASAPEPGMRPLTPDTIDSFEAIFEKTELAL